MDAEDRRINTSRIKLYFPIIFIQIYLIGTIGLYEFGPLKWETPNKGNFYSLIIAYQLALLIGYYSGIKIKNTKPTKKVNINKLEKYLLIALIINIVMTILMTVRLSGMTSISIDVLINKFIMGLTNPAYQYNQKFTSVEYGGSLLTYSSVILSPITWTSLPLGIYYFGKISKKIDILVLIRIIVEIAYWVIRGTNKGLFDLIIIITTVLILKKIKEEKIKKRLNIKVKIVLITLFIAIFIYFGKNISDRIGQNFNIISQICNGVEINTNTGFTKLLPEGFQNLVVILTSYLTQGYHGMSMAISLPFTGTLGIGNSIFLLENLKQITGINFLNRTYQYKLEQFGWDSQVNWHSFYLWVANDVHFVGVVFIMFVIGYIYANLVKDFILNGSNISICLLVLFMITFFYIPANNQIGTIPNTCVTFIVLIGIWIFRKINRKFSNII